MQGSIQKRIGKRGVTWTVVADMPPDPVTGRRRQKRISAPTKKEIEQLVAQHIQSVNTGTYVDASKLTLGDYLTQWLGALEGVGPATRRRYADLVRLHVVPVLGSRLLVKVTPLDVQALYSDRKAAGLSPTTTNLLHNMLHRALKQAVDWDMLLRNPTERVTAPRPAAPEPATWDAGQVARFLAAADATDDGALWRVAICTGMRRSELLGLQWADVDLERGVLNVRHARKRGEGNRWETGAPKTRKGRRQIALPPSAVEALRQHRRRQVEYRLQLGTAYHDQGYVFAGDEGQPMHPNVIAKRFARLVAVTSLPAIKLHGLRHTNATVSLAAGEHPKIVQERLGHSTISMTLDRYSHVTESMQREAAARLDALLSAAQIAEGGEQPPGASAGS
jgi:integrase